VFDGRTWQKRTYVSIAQVLCNALSPQFLLTYPQWLKMPYPCSSTPIVEVPVSATCRGVEISVARAKTLPRVGNWVFPAASVCRALFRGTPLACSSGIVMSSMRQVSLALSKSCTLILWKAIRPLALMLRPCVSDSSCKNGANFVHAGSTRGT